MTFYTVVNTRHATLLADDPLVPADQIESLASAVDAARALSALHETMAERVRSAEEKAREEGRREGVASGEAAAAEQLAERLLVLEQRSEREREALRARGVQNALGIVRRIASTLGEAETLAALARDAARELLPSATVLVQVHPTQLEAVRERLSEFGDTPLQIESDESLEPDQCRLKSSGGVAVLAGLETQLGSIERQTRDVAAGS